MTKETLMRFEPKNVHLNDHYLYNHSGRYHWANSIFVLSDD